MADRNSLTQVKFRLRNDVLRKLERDAKRDDRSVNDEIGRRLEASYRDEEEIRRLTRECERLVKQCDEMAAERQMIVTAMASSMRSHPHPVETLAALEALDDNVERRLQAETFTDDYMWSDRDENPSKRARKRPVARKGEADSVP
jgi:hypothetical protein